MNLEEQPEDVEEQPEKTLNELRKELSELNECIVNEPKHKRYKTNDCSVEKYVELNVEQRETL